MSTWFIIIGVIAALLLLCFLLAVANYSGERFMQKYEEMNNIEAKTKLTSIDFVDFVVRRFIKTPIEIVQISAVAGDAYSKRKLFLSTDTIYKPSLASFTIIAHELGHALQDVSGNKLKKLNRLRRLGKFLGCLMMPSLLSGLILLFFGGTLFIVGCSLLAFGVFIFILALIVKMMTISIEKDASKNAMTFLKEVFEEEDLKRCKRFLNDARLTYWAEFLKIILFWTGVSKRGKLFN